jgi:hypothetical protein
MRAAFFIFTIFILQACATTYQGEAPNFKLTGAAARAEAAKFALNADHHVVWRGDWFEMGPSGEHYSISSLRPVIDPVSPTAQENLVRARRWRIAQIGAVGTAAIAATMALALTQTPSQQTAAAVAALSAGAAFGFGFVYDSLVTSAATQFNHDLGRSFTPALTWRTDF